MHSDVYVLVTIGLEWVVAAGLFKHVCDVSLYVCLLIEDDACTENTQCGHMFC